MPTSSSKLDALRVGRGEIENHYLDEPAAGGISRREFVAKARCSACRARSCGSGACRVRWNEILVVGVRLVVRRDTPPTKGGTLRLACQVPTAAINPMTVADLGG